MRYPLGAIFMTNIFNHSELEQPQDNEFLWRFIKPKYIKHFIHGELYFSQLTEFDDYYESITPMHHLVLSYMNKMYGREIPPENKGLVHLRTLFQRMAFGMELSMFQKHLKEITKSQDKDVNWKALANAIDDIENIHNKHIENQLKTHASCWFIGNFTESALMWSSYSQPGGIAIKIRFSDFKRLIQDYFKFIDYNNRLSGINRILGGKIKYLHYRMEPQWSAMLESGTPPSFIKHASFKQENEYRLIIERTEKIQDDSEKVFRPFISHDYFDIILHPSASIEDFESLKEKLKDKLQPRISFSELAYRVREKID